MAGSASIRIESTTRTTSNANQRTRTTIEREFSRGLSFFLLKTKRTRRCAFSGIEYRETEDE